MSQNHNLKEETSKKEYRKSRDAASASGRSHTSDRHRSSNVDNHTVRFTERDRYRMNDLYERSGW